MLLTSIQMDLAMTVQINLNFAMHVLIVKEEFIKSFVQGVVLAIL